MDCGSQTLQRAAHNHLECEKSLASSEACVRPDDPLQISGMRDVLARFSMISLRLTSTLPHH